MNGWIQELPLSQLLEVWEMTTNCNEPEIPMVRGWLMDEIERRVPERFNVWLSLPYVNGWLQVYDADGNRKGECALTSENVKKLLK